MKLIRNGVFETNSSSCHTVTIGQGTNLIPYKSDDIHIATGGYGWEIDQYYDMSSRLSYAATYMMNHIYSYESSIYDLNHELAKMFIDVIKDYTDCKNIYIDNICITGDSKLIRNNEKLYHDFGYIDHQSHDEASLIFESKESLKNFLFDDNSYFTTDNDNH